MIPKSHFRKTKTFAVIISMIWILSACDTKSNVEFGNTRKEVNQPKVQFGVLTTHQGGVVNGPTAGGYKVNVSSGVQANQVKGTTAGNFRVQMNFPGQSTE